MTAPRRPVVEALLVLLVLGGLGLCYGCLAYLARHDYAAASLLALAGLGTLHAGSRALRWALAERS